MVNVNGTDRDLQYVFDNHFFNSDLRDRKGLVFADPSTIHHGKHQASEILVSSDGKTGTLLNYLRNKTLPSGFSRNYSIPTHPATMVFFSSGKSLQELVDVGDFSCTAGWYCEGSYSVRVYADCSTSRNYCSYGCSGGGCRSPPRTSGSYSSTSSTSSVKWSSGSACQCTPSLTDGANAGTTTRDCLPAGESSCGSDGSVGWGEAHWDRAQYLDGARVWRQRKNCVMSSSSCPVRREPTPPPPRCANRDDRCASGYYRDTWDKWAFFFKTANRWECHDGVSRCITCWRGSWMSSWNCYMYRRELRRYLFAIKNYLTSRFNNFVFSLLSKSNPEP